MSKAMKNVEDLGLKSNAKYGDSCRAEIYHTPSEEWFPVVETRNKVVFYIDANEKVRRANLNKIDGRVNFVDGHEPENLGKKNNSTPNVEPLVWGLYTNTNYADTGVEVEHADIGWCELLATANKVLYIKKDGRSKMSLPKLVGVRGIESPENLEKEDEAVLTNKDDHSEKSDFGEELFEEASA